MAIGSIENQAFENHKHQHLLVSLSPFLIHNKPVFLQGQPAFSLLFSAFRFYQKPHR
jgi:hypothetical protein